MACTPPDPNQPLPRISGRTGNPINLNVIFYKNGIPTDPFAIRVIKIYRTAVQEDNLVATIPIQYRPDETPYPYPVSRISNSTSSEILPGQFSLIWDIPITIAAPDIYFDEWSYIPSQPTNYGGSTGDHITGDDRLAILNNETYWQKACNRFWIYPDHFFVDSGLETIKIGFEALDIKLYQPESKTIEVGMTPLPLYDYDYNYISPIIPRLTAYINMWTDSNEQVISDSPMNIGLRQGTYRTNPFVLRYLINSGSFFKGSYKYRITLCLPNGETRVSPDFFLQIS